MHTLSFEMAPKRILIVEDDFMIRETIAELLREEGYEITCAPNGLEALRLLADGAPPDLILLDLMMPIMNGWELRHALALDPRLAHIPVVVISAGSTGSERASAMGADGFLPKPFEMQSLLATVGRYC